MAKITSYPAKEFQVAVLSATWLWIEGYGTAQDEERRHHLHRVDKRSDKGDRKKKETSVYDYNACPNRQGEGIL